MSSREQGGILRDFRELGFLLPKKETAAPNKEPRQAGPEHTGEHSSKVRGAKRKKGKAQKQKPSPKNMNATKAKLLRIVTRTPQRAGDRAATDLLGTPLQSTAKPAPVQPLSQVPGKTLLDKVDPMAAMPDFVPRTMPSAPDIADIAARLQAPRAWFRPRNVAGRKRTDIVIGLDVGSTSTKIVFRRPFESSNMALPVPAPDWLRADSHPYYWRTILWEGSDGAFGLLPTEGAAALPQLKVALLKAAAEKRAHDLAVTHMAAYVALIIRQALGWFRQTYPRLTADNAETVFVPSINVGFPAASMERTSDQQLFTLCCKAGGELGVSDEPVTLSTVARSLEMARGQRDDLVEVFPELSGAVAGFVRSSASRDGSYALLDIGGLTLDCVLFNLVGARSAEPRCSVLAASVRRYGAEIVRHVIGQGCGEHDACEILARSVTNTLLAGFQTKISRPSMMPDQPVFLIGGGRHSPSHRSAVARVPRQMKDTHWPVRIQASDLMPPRSEIEVPFLGDRNFGRLLVAAGLSHSRLDIPTWTRSADVANAAIHMRGRYTERFVGKELT